MALAILIFSEGFDKTQKERVSTKSMNYFIRPRLQYICMHAIVYDLPFLEVWPLHRMALCWPFQYVNDHPVFSLRHIKITFDEHKMHKKAAPNYAVSCKGPDRLAPGLAKKNEKTWRI